MFDPERAVSQLNSYQDALKSDPDAREIMSGMPFVRDRKDALLKEIIQNGFIPGIRDGKWYVRYPEK